MKELITAEQANQLMIAILAGAPVLGLIFGAFAKRVKYGLLVGIVIGAGNFGLWKIYGAITDHLGLDTVKNLIVNLVLFVIVGVVTGLVWGKLTQPKNTTV